MTILGAIHTAFFGAGRFARQHWLVCLLILLFVFIWPRLTIWMVQADPFLIDWPWLRPIHNVMAISMSFFWCLFGWWIYRQAAGDGPARLSAAILVIFLLYLASSLIFWLAFYAASFAALLFPISAGTYPFSRDDILSVAILIAVNLLFLPWIIFLLRTSEAGRAQALKLWPHLPVFALALFVVWLVYYALSFIAFKFGPAVYLQIKGILQPLFLLHLIIAAPVLAQAQKANSS